MEPWGTPQEMSQGDNEHMTYHHPLGPPCWERAEPI